MSREFLVLPHAKVSTSEDVWRHLAAQQSRPPADEDHVNCVGAALEGWNESVVRHGRPDGQARWGVAGDTVQMWIPDDAVKILLPIIIEVARPAHLYDADSNELTALSRKRPAQIDIGGENSASWTTLDELHDWIPRLHRLARTPFLIVARPDDPGTFIQTYRGSALEPHDENPSYSLEFACGSPDRMYNTELDDPHHVAELMWDWLENRWHGLLQVSWEKWDPPNGMTSVPSLADELHRIGFSFSIDGATTS